MTDDKSLGGDDTGFVPPDATTGLCEDKVARNLTVLRHCINACHITAADNALKRRPFDEEACEHTDPVKSCVAKYSAVANRLAANTKPATGICPACLDAAHQASLAAQMEAALDDAGGAIYCAGTVPLDPTP